MRVLISVDMEGVAGVTDPFDISPGNAEYERNRIYMTNEAAAAVRGVWASHPDADVFVCDAHAKFRNLLPHLLPRGSTLLRGSPRAHSMMTGIGEGVDAVIYIGYHGRAGTANSVLAHTISGTTVSNVRCAGQDLGEFGLNLLLAAHYGARSVLATGDDTLVAEAVALVPGIATVAVKRPFGSHAALGLHPEDACERIETAARKALNVDLDDYPLTRPGQPVVIEVTFRREVMTELAVMIPGVDRTGPSSVAFETGDFPAAYDLIDVLVTLAAAG